MAGARPGHDPRGGREAAQRKDALLPPHPPSLFPSSPARPNPPPPATPPAASSINDRSVSGIACHTRPYSAAVMSRRLATASLDESKTDLTSDFDKILPSGVRMPEVPRIQPVGFFVCGVFRRVL